jgi:N-acetylglucosaminyldiphosphoundecaprenol N-acetyl-beta-D-mannosaminyltransferase
MTCDYRLAPSYQTSLSILGVQLNPVSVDDVHQYIVRVIEQGERALVMHLNVHCVNLCQKHGWLRDFMNQANMVFCDGDGVRWGLRILGMSPPPKITYDRWIWQLAELAEQQGYRCYFFGGRPGVAEAAARNISQRFPRLKIVGTQHGYFDKLGAENDRVVAEINRAKPDILILGFGMPTQEQWLRDNWHTVDAHVLLTGGAVFDYVSGRARRAPAWMIRWHLEWLFRLLQEPRRLFKRYIWGNPYFMAKICQEKLFPRHSTK